MTITFGLFKLKKKDHSEKLTDDGSEDTFKLTFEDKFENKLVVKVDRDSTIPSTTSH